MKETLHPQFEKIYNQNRRDIYLYLKYFTLNEEDALDLTQDTIVSFIRYFETRKLPESLIDCRKILFRIARNLALNKIKRSKQNISLDRNDLSPEKLNISLADTSPGNDAYRRLLKNDRDEFVWKILGSLDENYRSALLFRYMQEMSLEDIADIMELSISVVSRLIERAKRHFVIQMNEKGIEKDILFENE